MTITFFKSRCLVCWKGFEVPLLLDSSYGDNLYYDKSAKTFSYFSWFDNKEIENWVTDFLSKKPELQFSNDNTKGNTARQIVGLMANGDKECVLGYNRCPRCGLKFISVSDKRTEIKEIETLIFTIFLNLDNKARHQYLLDRTKNGL
jgi:hypothetical protein